MGGVGRFSGVEEVGWSRMREVGRLSGKGGREEICFPTEVLPTRGFTRMLALALTDCL